MVRRLGDLRLPALVLRRRRRFIASELVESSQRTPAAPAARPMSAPVREVASSMPRPDVEVQPHPRPESGKRVERAPETFM
jgi:hypothetical protein